MTSARYASLFGIVVLGLGLTAGPAFPEAAATCAAPPARSLEPGDVLWSFSYFGEGGQDYFHQPSDIETDPKLALIYVVDSGNNRVVAFDYDGRWVRTLGREGQGPGELSRPTGACVFGDSRLAVADFGNTRIQIFDSSGEYLRAVLTKDVKVADLLVIDDAFYTIPSFGVSGFSLNMGSQEETQPLVAVLDGEGGVVREISVSDFPETHPFIRALKHRVCLALSPDGRLFLPFSNMNLIQVLDLEGSKLAQFDRRLPFDPIPPQLMDQRTSREGEQQVIQMRARLDQVSQAAHFGPDGRLYILTFAASLDRWLKKFDDPKERPPLPMRVDVIDPGSLSSIRSIEVDPGTRAFAVLPGGRLVIIYEDDAGELVLKALRF